MPLRAGEGISSCAAPEPQPRASRSRALLCRAILGICFFSIYLLLTRSDIILQARSGFSVWYPANGLAFAFMLGISPWYAPLAAVADFLSAVIFYHERLFRNMDRLPSNCCALLTNASISRKPPGATASPRPM